MDGEEKRNNVEDLNKKDDLISSAVEASILRGTRISKINEQRKIMEEAMKIRDNIIKGQDNKEEYISRTENNEEMENEK